MIANPTSRRDFLKITGLTGFALLGAPLSLLNSCATDKLAAQNMLIEKYGPLLSDPNHIFDLPAGFFYQIVARTGSMMDDGLLMPDKPDGMATFAGRDNRVILVRNHELMPGNSGPFGVKDELADKVERNRIYDLGDGKTICPGGTTTLVINETNLEVEKSFLSLTGTLQNCSGGPTPWGTWISSEEVVVSAGTNSLQKHHGYNFEVPAVEEIGLAEPVPLKAMGRFRHEAVGIDPRTSIAYQTEDLEDGLIYRFLPDEPGNYRKGGRLQALGVKGRRSLDTRNWEGNVVRIGERMPVKWIDLDDVDAPNDDLRYRGFHRGAAVFARGEGMWFDKEQCYFACTSGGRKKLGQIFRYVPSPYEGTPRESEIPGTLELYLAPNDSSLVQWCDNITVAPWGDLIACEDNLHSFLLGVTPERQIYKLGRNVGYESELTGCVFSPSGRTLFVNIQRAGLTLAIQGPWLDPAS